MRTPKPTSVPAVPANSDVPRHLVKTFKAVNEGRTVQTRRFRVGDRDVTIRLEAVMWKILEEMCRRERRTLHEIVNLVASQSKGTSIVSGLRVFVAAHLAARRTER